MSTAPKAPDILVEIAGLRRRRFDGGRPPQAEDGPLQLPWRNAFTRAIEERSGSAIVAEVKMGSPKLGSLVGRFDPERQAEAYARGGAAALSVVVEPDYFHGSYDLLRHCREASGLPALAKDFLVDPRQLELAAEAGASAVLLIASLFERDELLAWAAAARALGLAPLIETHDAADVDALDGAEWELVGVNNRDLRTFEVDLEHSIGLVPRLPAGALRVAESGIRSRTDVEELAAAGFDAFLIGETLLTAEAPGARLAELRGDAP